MNAVDDYNVGVAYEHWICERLGLTHDARRQAYGDTSCGTEIKFDRQLHKTGNLFFESEQIPIDLVANTRRGRWVKCGCFKQCRHYLIGDCSRALLFEGQLIRDWFQRGMEAEERRRFYKEGPTFRGYAIPWRVVKFLALARCRYAWKCKWDEVIKSASLVSGE